MRPEFKQNTVRKDSLTSWSLSYELRSSGNSSLPFRIFECTLKISLNCLHAVLHFHVSRDLDPWVVSFTLAHRIGHPIIKRVRTFLVSLLVRQILCCASRTRCRHSHCTCTTKFQGRFSVCNIGLQREVAASILLRLLDQQIQPRGAKVGGR